jgi:hypothetical protein
MEAKIGTKTNFQLKGYSKSGKLYSNINKDSILQRMDSTLPGWRKDRKTFVFPLVSKPKYAGPTLNASEWEIGCAKGDNSETIVLWAMKKLSDKNNFGFRIFQGLNIEQKMCQVVGEAFGKNENEINKIIADIETASPKSTSGKKPQPLIQRSTTEISDVILLHQHGIAIIEIKSSKNANTIQKAKKQLLCAVKISKMMMEIIGIEADSIPIQKLIAFPESENTEEEKQLDDFNFLLKSDLQDYKILYDKLFPSKGAVISSKTLDDLSAAFALLKFGIILKSSKEIPENLLKQNMLEAHAISGQLLAIEKQDFLQSKSKKKKLEDDEKVQKRMFNSIVLWLDPRQRQIMDEEVQKHQYIIGPPGTGKTLLIQLKVLEVYQKNPESKVLIILPYEPLVDAYKKFFEESGFDTTGSGSLILVKCCKFN